MAIALDVDESGSGGGGKAACTPLPDLALEMP
jgi:hypothetical protein